VGSVISVGELLAAMQIHSSNIATNQLIDLVGKPYINATADLVGAPTLRVYRKLYTEEPVEPDNPRRNEATARGYIELYREISTGAAAVLSPCSRQYLVGLLAQCHAHNRFNREFPEGVTFYHKTGSTSDSSSDAGYYYLPTGEIAILVGLQDFRDFHPLVRAGLALFNLLQQDWLF
jgi:beta-lactamase class A